MATLEKLLNTHDQQALARGERQDSQEDARTKKREVVRKKADLAQIISESAEEATGQGAEHHTLPYSDIPRSKDKSSEVQKRTTGMSSLILSPQAKVELIEASKGDFFRKARELENQLYLAEKGVLDPKHGHLASSIHSPEGGTSLREKIVVHMAEPEKQLDAAEARILSGGPGGLVLDTIAADAGVSKGGLLYHFPSKEALVAGLCERMLDGFERTLASLTEADGTPGSWTRAYLASTVTQNGRPADESAQLMAAILATLGRDSAHLEAVREHFARWHRRIAQDGIDPQAAIIVRLAADGLWLSSLLGLNELNESEGPSLISALRSMTRPEAAAR